MSSQISLSEGSNSSHASKYCEIMLIREDGGIADKHILKTAILIYPGCYCRSLINMNLYLSFVNIVPFICLFFYVTVWRSFKRRFCADVTIQRVFRFALFRWFMSIFRHALQSVLCVASAEKKKKSLQLHSQSNGRSRIEVGSSPPPDLNPITPYNLYRKYIKFVFNEKKDPLWIKILSR